ncbi:angiopoietin-related protein 3-like [Scyliorhinus canicula]|uniref:angiopoietin-related protein 3-like n=1 Tax=Scyliorhinus canicula TaxID=7830 RepID=UPI0018F3D116|nr:angiopoietin-related protein 3-like [Scyliorhinus canicula]
MKTVHFIVIICLICSMSGLPGNTRRGEKSQFASSDDISLLAHGLYLLGKGLKEHTNKIKGEMNAVLGQLNVYNSSINNLGSQVRLIKSDEKDLQGKALKLEIEDEELHKRIMELRNELRKALQDQQSVANKVDSVEGKRERILENYVEKNKSADVPFYRSATEFQNQRIDEVVVLLKAQQQQIDEQNQQIQLLVNKISNADLDPRKHFKKDVKGSNSLGDQWSIQNEASSDSDCDQIFKRGERTSGIYSIQPKGSQLLQTYCQMTAESGWTVIQRRYNGTLDFDRSWLEYITGFGDLHGEFWLGLESFYQVAHRAKYILRIELEDWKNDTRYIEYTFKIGGKDNNYTLQIGQVLSGDLSSAMSDCKALPFSTSDRDNDLHTVINCAEQHSGGWWFSACGEANLNGKYLRSRISRRPDRKKGIFWKTWKGNYYSFKSTQLMVRPMEIAN